MEINAKGYSSLTSLSEETSSRSLVFLLLPIGLGMGDFQSSNNSATMGAAPSGRLDVVSGMLALTRTLGQSTGIATNGAIWSALALRYSGTFPVTSATNAPAAAQVIALQNLFIFSASIILVAWVLAFWAWINERRMRAKEQKLEREPTISGSSR